MIIGFSTGCLYKTHDRLARSTFDIFKKIGCNAIEIMFHDISDIEKIEQISADDLKCFQYVSLHAPEYKKNEKELFNKCLNAISRLNEKRKLDLVVLHPDKIEDWSIFSNYELPFAIENMDDRKISHKNTLDLTETFEKDFKGEMVLDLSHCFVNDPSMKLAEELKINFNKKIKEIHLSGHVTFHDLLYKTKQKEILNQVMKDIPIIIESGCEDVEDVLKEYEYIVDVLSV